MNAKQRSLFDIQRDDIIFIAVKNGPQAVTNEDGTIKTFDTKAEADDAKGPLGVSAAVKLENLSKALYGAKMQEG